MTLMDSWSISDYSSHREALDEMDFECGDADCGGTHRDAAEALLATLEASSASRGGP